MCVIYIQIFKCIYNIYIYISYIYHIYICIYMYIYNMYIFIRSSYNQSVIHKIVLTVRVLYRNTGFPFTNIPEQRYSRGRGRPLS